MGNHKQWAIHNNNIMSIYQVCYGNKSVYPFLYQRRVFPTLKFMFHQICFAPLSILPKKAFMFQKQQPKTSPPGQPPGQPVIYKYIYIYIYIYICIYTYMYMYMYIYYICGKMQLFRYKFFVF